MLGHDNAASRRVAEVTIFIAIAGLWVPRDWVPSLTGDGGRFASATS